MIVTALIDTALATPAAGPAVDVTSASAPIPYVDLAGQHAPLKEALLAAVASVIDSGQFILGPQVAEFERAFAKLCGAGYAVGVNSGTDALILALQALGIGEGDEVITVPNSFIASTTCLKLVGARPVFVDVRDDYLIDPEQIEAAITTRTRAILPVHLTGRPCAMEAIMEIAQRHGLAVIEDAAQAVRAAYKGRRVGSFGPIGCFSLHPLKTLNACGDAGVMTTDDPTLYERLVVMRNIGMRTRDDIVLWSQNTRLDTMQAAMLLVKLRFLDGWTARRQENARLYRAFLAGIPQVQVPHDAAGEEAVYHTFVVQVENREALRDHLAAQGIGTSIHYPTPIHLTTIGKELGYAEGSFPVAERQAARILSLPVYPELTPAQIERVCQSIRAFYAGH